MKPWLIFIFTTSLLLSGDSDVEMQEVDDFPEPIAVNQDNHDPSHFLKGCEQELGLNGDGRYPQEIAKQFNLYGQIVLILGPKQNLFCECEQPLFMRCKIQYNPATQEGQQIAQRIDRKNPNLYPFFPRIIPSAIENPINPPVAFQLPNSAVIASVSLRQIVQRAPPTITVSDEWIPPTPNHPYPIRSHSAPADLFYPTKSLPASQCMGYHDAIPGIDQLTEELLDPNDIVYIHKRDAAAVQAGRRVRCYAAGLMRQRSDFQSGDYEAYVVTAPPHPFQPLQIESSVKLGTLINTFSPNLLLSILSFSCIILSIGLCFQKEQSAAEAGYVQIA